jgi:alpha-beta hydrolase superfamily lysophospholipase
VSPRAKKRVRLAALALALIVVAWLGSSAFVASRLTHRRHPRAPESVPADLRASTQELRLTTSDHEDIGAWFVEGRAEEPIVVLLHGLGGSRSALVSRMRLLAGTGCGLLAVTLRAHGDSSGDTVDVGWSARAVVTAAVEWIGAHHPARRIVVDGTSMGAAAAMFAARELGERVSGYVLECPYSDLCTAVKNRLELALPPVLDSVAWAGLRTVAPVFLPDMDRIRPIDAASSIPLATPVLILSSKADRHARPDEARAIFERLRDHAEILWFDDAAHDRLVESHPEAWKTAVMGLIEKSKRVQRGPR